MLRRYIALLPEPHPENQAENKKLTVDASFASLVLNILMTAQDLALELFRVLVPQLGGLAVQR